MRSDEAGTRAMHREEGTGSRSNQNFIAKWMGQIKIEAERLAWLVECMVIPLMKEYVGGKPRVQAEIQLVSLHPTSNEMAC